MTTHCKPDPTEYAPYHHYAEFWHGVADQDEYHGHFGYPVTSDASQRDAYDKGREYAVRLARWVDGMNATIAKHYFKS